MKKIAILHPSFLNKGGAENVVIWLAGALSKKGYSVTLFTSEYDESFFGKKEDKKYIIKELKVKGHKFNLLSFFYWIKAGFKLRKELEGFDVINPHNFPSYIWIYYAKKFNQKLINKKIIWYCEEPFRAFYSEITDKNCLKAKAVGKTEDLKQKIGRWFKKWGIKTPYKMILLLMEKVKYKIMFYFGIKIDRKVVPAIKTILTNSQFIADNMHKIFSVKAFACPLGIPINRDIVDKEYSIGDYLLTVSRLNFEKNNLSILKAIKVLKDKNKIPFSRYILIGNGPEKDNLISYVNKNNLNNVVEFKGFVSNDELNLVYSKAGAIIYLSLDETFGLVFLEAAQYQKPVIGPSHGGPTEIIVDGQTGVVVDALDEKKIAEKILEIFSDKERMAKFGRAGRFRLMKNYKFNDFINRFEKFL